MALATVSGVDSRVILDVSGAEDLLGRGDMLFKPPWLLEPVRLQGCFVSDAEVRATALAHQKPTVSPEPVERPETPVLDHDRMVIVAAAMALLAVLVMLRILEVM